MAGPTAPDPKRFFDAYEGTPPWDVGHPQLEFVALSNEHELRGPLLDVGCGTGENGLFFAHRGLDVVGVDLVPAAIEKARAKSQERGVRADFEVGDALAFDLGRQFQTIIDCGVFHVFPDNDRSTYVERLAHHAAKGADLFVLVFSDAETRSGGPRRIREAEMHESFAPHWEVVSVKPADFQVIMYQTPARAWLGHYRRS